MKFEAIENEIYVDMDNGCDRVKTLIVVGGSFSKAGLAREICDVLNRHYGTKGGPNDYPIPNRRK